MVRIYVYVCHVYVCTHTRYMKVRITCATVKIPGTSEFTETLFTNFTCVPVYRYTGSPHSGNRLILTFTYMYVYIHVCVHTLLAHFLQIL